MHGYDNDTAWKRSLTSMFDGIKLRDCTPLAILDTMKHMQRASNRLEDITIAARQRNIAASDESTREALIVLYRDGKIKHRELAGRHFFIYPTK